MSADLHGDPTVRCDHAHDQNRPAVESSSLLHWLQWLRRLLTQVDLLLVLAADVSRSVDAAKFKLQRDGYAAAISNPRVLTRFVGPRGRIGVTFVEWSGVGAQRS